MRGAGNGRLVYNGAEYGTDGWQAAAKGLNLSQEQKDQIDGAAALAKAAGIEITLRTNAEVAESMGMKPEQAKGMLGSESKSGIVLNLGGVHHIDTATGRAVSGQLMVTLGHEMTHWLQRNSLSGYNRLQSFVVGELQRNGANVSAMVTRVMEEREAAGQPISLNEAVAEIVANACDQVLANEEVAERIQKEKPGLAAEIKNFVRNLVARIRKAVGGMNQRLTRESYAMLNSANELAKVWLGAYDEAISEKLAETKEAEAREREAAEEKNEEAQAEETERKGKHERYSFAQLTELDEEYAEAVESGDLKKATAMLMERLMHSENIIPFISAEWYSGKHRTIAQLIKEGVPEAVAQAAGDMASYVPDNAVLVPMPDHHGKVNENTDTMVLARAISELTGRPVVPALEGNDRQSRFASKQSGYNGQKVTAETMGFRQVQEIPDGTIPIFIDNVVGSGETAKAAYNAMGGGITLAYAKGRSVGIEGLKSVTVTYDKNKELIPLSRRFDASVRNVNYSMAQNGVDITKPVREQLTAYLKLSKNEKKATNKVILFGTTPQTLVDIGMAKLPMTMNFKHVGYMLEGNYPDTENNYRENHIFDIEELSHLAEMINHPIAIIKDSNPDAIKVLIGMKSISGIEAVVPITINIQKTMNSKRYDVNNLASAYGNTNIINDLVAAIQKDSETNHRLYFVDKEKTLRFVSASQGYFPGRVTIPDGFIHSIDQSALNVNDKKYRRSTPVLSQTDSIQFKRWFGKSKVREADGTPMLVYHGTNEKFNVFDMDKTRNKMDLKGAFFSPYEIEAGGYGENVGAFYLKIVKPATEQQMYAALNMFAGQENAGGKATEYLKAQGYDGVIGFDEYIVFDPTQIKSATDNVGLFDEDNPNYNYSIAQNNLDVSAWMDGLSEWSLRTEGERQLLRDYKGLRLSISLSLKKSFDFNDQIRKLQAKGDNMTAEDMEQVRALRNKVENEVNKRERLEEELQKITDSDGYAGMMYEQSHVLNDMIYGKTVEQVEQAANDMLREVEKLKKEIAQRRNELKELGESEAVRQIRAQMSKTSLKESATILRKATGTSLSSRLISDRLAEISLKMANGENVMGDCEELADLMVKGIQGRNEKLDLLRGMTLIIGPEEVKQLKAENSSLREIRQQLRRSGVNIKTGDVSRLDSQWAELRENDQSLPDIDSVPALVDKLHAVADFIENQVKTGDEMTRWGTDVSEITALVFAHASNVSADLVTDPAAKRVIARMNKEIQAMAKQAADSEAAMAAMEERMEKLEQAGEQAKLRAGMLKGDVKEALDYFNKTAKMAAQVERQKVREGLIAQLKNDNTRKLIEQV